MTNYPQPVTDFLSNYNDQLANAAGILGNSKHRQAIFETVYRGSKQMKTINEIMKETSLSQVHVLKEGGKMAGFLIEKVPGGYRKKKEFSTIYKKILSLARDKNKLRKLPTKISPAVYSKGRIIVNFSALAINARQITIDEIDSFSRIRGVNPPSPIKNVSENAIKEKFKAIIGEEGKFKDWGGEKSDLYTTRVVYNGKRVPTAVAFKGRATSGKLVPAKMGKNGDQINRLFNEPAELFLVIYNGQIEPSVIEQMKAFAIAHAVGGHKIMYGVVDGNDLGRVFVAYPDSNHILAD